MSLLAAAILVAGGAVLGGWLARASKREPSSDGDEDERNSAPHPAVPEPKQKAKDPFAAFPCRLGDVVLASDGEEAWLESALVLSEEAPVLVLFVAPNAGGDRAILARPKPREELLWLISAPPTDWGPSEEPPSSMLHRGERYERTRRLPLHVESTGTSAPDVGSHVVLAEYRSATDRRLVVIVGVEGRAARALLWEGRVLPPGAYEVLPGES